jgi:sulfate transport system substrate-binding protein
VVDANVRRKETQAAAEAYLKYLYTDDAQEVIARHFYRPINPDVLKQHAATFPSIDLFPIDAVAQSWDAAQQKFFAEGALFDAIFAPTGN